MIIVVIASPGIKSSLCTTYFETFVLIFFSVGAIRPPCLVKEESICIPMYSCAVFYVLRTTSSAAHCSRWYFYVSIYSRVWFVLSQIISKARLSILYRFLKLLESRAENPRDINLRQFFINLYFKRIFVRLFENSKFWQFWDRQWFLIVL